MSSKDVERHLQHLRGLRGDCYGFYLLDLADLLGLPLPSIRAIQLMKYERKDLWGFKVVQPGRESHPPTERISFNRLHDDHEKGLDVAMQELLGRICGHHSTILESHYLAPFGKRNEEGEPIGMDDATKETVEPARRYLQT